MLVLDGGVEALGLAIHPAPASHDPLHVLGRAGAANVQQTLLILRRGDTGEGPDLGVRQLAASEGLRKPREIRQRPGDADLLPGGAQIDAGAPGQPLGAGAEAVVPAALGVELADQVEQVAAAASR